MGHPHVHVVLLTRTSSGPQLQGVSTCLSALSPSPPATPPSAVGRLGGSDHAGGRPPRRHKPTTLLARPWAAARTCARPPPNHPSRLSYSSTASAARCAPAPHGKQPISRYHSHSLHTHTHGQRQCATFSYQSMQERTQALVPFPFYRSTNPVSKVQRLAANGRKGSWTQPQPMATATTHTSRPPRPAL